MTIEIIIVHPPDYNEQANLPVVSLLSLRKNRGLSMGFKHNRVLKRVWYTDSGGDHTNLKNRMVISAVATSKNHIELLVPGQIWDRICDPGQILV